MTSRSRCRLFGLVAAALLAACTPDPAGPAGPAGPASSSSSPTAMVPPAPPTRLTLVQRVIRDGEPTPLEPAYDGYLAVHYESTDGSVWRWIAPDGTILVRRSFGPPYGGVISHRGGLLLNNQGYPTGRRWLDLDVRLRAHRVTVLQEPAPGRPGDLLVGLYYPVVFRPSSRTVFHVPWPDRPLGLDPDGVGRLVESSGALFVSVYRSPSDRHPECWTSTDGGRTWGHDDPCTGPDASTTRSPKFPAPLQATSMVSSGELFYALGDRGRVWVSRDDGSNWTMLTGSVPGR